jgi:hypothetical protein
VSLLKPGDLVPHFDVTTIDGQVVSYSTVWQRRNLVLVTVADRDAEYAAELRAHAGAFAQHGAVCVATREAIGGLPERGVLIADRWGEIVHMTDGDLPDASDVLAWLDYIERRCPECEGETK